MNPGIRFPKQYRWRDGVFSEHTPTFDNAHIMPRKGTYVVCWNEIGGCWDLSMSNGTMLCKVWDKEHLPPGLKTNLLILGVTL